jgi:small basic protein (TIGR04137 family)
MSIDKTLRSKSTLARHRNVLSRAERITHLQEVGKWDDESTATGLPKVAHRKAAVGKKTKKKDEAAAEAAPADKKKK